MGGDNSASGSSCGASPTPSWPPSRCSLTIRGSRCRRCRMCMGAARRSRRSCTRERLGGASGGSDSYRRTPTHSPRSAVTYWAADTPSAHPADLIVLTLASAQISALTRFLDDDIFRRFDLPPVSADSALGSRAAFRPYSSEGTQRLVFRLTFRPARVVITGAAARPQSSAAPPPELSVSP